jgi:YYY domain-containing protein
MMAETNEQNKPEPVRTARWDRAYLYDLLMLAVLLAAAALRLTGIDWASEQYLHPDERHLVNVESALATVRTFGEYWDTANSTLNPHNVGYNFFVYGTLPIIAVRYAAEWLGQTGYSEIMIVGRQLSAISDLLVVLLVYLTASRVFDRRVGLAAGMFSAFTVLQIQLSHFFAVDTFLTLFSMLAVYLAARLAIEKPSSGGTFFRPHLFVLFGIALGMAVASKLNTLPVAMVLPLAVWVRLSRLEREEWVDAAWQASGYLFLAAMVSFLTFRVFQPYAFSGPGFFGMVPNQKWVDNIRELMSQQTGDFDWPPSIQWARRPVWFSFQNMVLWGMGLPMALMAWGGFLAAGWQLLTGKWRKHLVLWVWTTFYFGWQSMAFNPTMRYQIPVYPTLAIFAGWALVSLWDRAGEARKARPVLRGAALAVGAAAIALTAWWAVAFTQIYERPITRVAASEWIYQNVPGPLTLQVETDEGTYAQPLPFSYDQQITPDTPFFTSFTAKTSGTLRQIAYLDVSAGGGDQTVSVTLTERAGLDVPVFAQLQPVALGQEAMPMGVSFLPDPPPIVPGGREFLLRVDVGGLSGLVLEDGYIRLDGVSGPLTLPVTTSPVSVYPGTGHFEFTFSLTEAAALQEIYLFLSPGESQLAAEQKLRLTLDIDPAMGAPLAAGEVTVDGLEDGINAEGGVFELGSPVEIKQGELYFIRIENLTTGGAVSLSGTPLAVEGPWDDGLPMRTNGYDGYSGIYPRGLNLDMNADDNPEKVQRFLEVLDASEYLTISSSRQWASTTRIPERFPLNAAYYRALLGCPPERTIEWCYNVAQPGMFSGDLGFELIKVFQSDPAFLGVQINDQFAEEAFTVYDHPKVFIFQKSGEYDPDRTAAILGAVDFDQVVRLTPQQASNYKPLLLSDERMEQQRTAGTWSELFDTSAWYNRSGIGAALVWYLALSALGWVVFPLVRLALPDLPDAGFPLVRTAGMLLLAYLSWLAGSLGLGYTRPMILGVAILLAAAGIGLAVWRRMEISAYLRTNWRQMLIAEAVFLVVFLLVLGVRFGNPDLWHPFKGGEKPMDFAYFNAILKTNAFPAYDPWYAGGYINYYYFGFVFVGTLVKLLGIVPATAYNLILPTISAMIFSGAFSISGNLYARWRIERSISEDQGQKPGLPVWGVGVAGGLMTAILGNLGTVKLVIEGFQRLAAQGDYSREAAVLVKLGWTLRGLGQVISGIGLPFGIAEFYWQPSRVIPALNEPEPITEFPWFTTIYADLHAHYMSLALVSLGLAWCLAVVFSRAWQGASRWQIAGSVAFAGMAIGALRPTNTWDLPAYLALGLVAVAYAVLRYTPPDQRLTRLLASAGGLAFLTFFLYQPFAHWYGLPYSEVMLWKGTHTPLSSYFVHWGLFLFILVFWMGWESRQWMAATPLSALRPLLKYRQWPWYGGGAVVLVMLVLSVWLKVRIHWLALPLLLWAGVLILRPGQSDSKRAVLFLIGTSLFLTVLVEVIVLSGDIGRMNTVFKFYLQAWVMLAASSAAALGWTLEEFRLWRPGWQSAWRVGVAALALGALLYPLTATPAKIQDRMSTETPATLDGMAFMQDSVYPDEGGVVLLAEDYQAIRWLQENVTGTPVIVEASTPLYRWGSRYSIYTGLPTVLGWDWHQTQQRGFSPATAISQRQQEIRMFYQIDDREEAVAFLQRYQVEYIILGQLERNYYPGAGLAKFDRLNGDLWQEVYREGQTVIYQIIDPPLSAAE